MFAKGGGSSNKNTSKGFKLLRLQKLTFLKSPPLIQEEEILKSLSTNNL